MLIEMTAELLIQLLYPSVSLFHFFMFNKSATFVTLLHNLDSFMATSII